MVEAASIVEPETDQREQLLARATAGLIGLTALSISFAETIESQAVMALEPEAASALREFTTA